MIKYDLYNQKRFVVYKHKNVFYVLDKHIQEGDEFMLIRGNLWGEPGQIATLIKNYSDKCEVKSAEGRFQTTYLVQADMPFCQNNNCVGGKVIGYVEPHVVKNGQQFDLEDIFIPYEFEGELKDRQILITV